MILNRIPAPPEKKKHKTAKTPQQVPDVVTNPTHQGN
jgi:hypothetical protein